MRQTVVVYTDGACGANRIGGWAWWTQPRHATDRPEPLEGSGWVTETTNNVMELRAVIEALTAFDADAPLEIVSDSMYVIGAMWERWYDRWRRENWVIGRKPVANREVWEELLAQLQAHRAPVDWTHIRGHGKRNSRGELPDPNHVSGNDAADRLAVAARLRGTELHPRGA